MYRNFCERGLKPADIHQRLIVKFQDDTLLKAHTSGNVIHSATVVRHRVISLSSKDADTLLESWNVTAGNGFISWLDCEMWQDKGHLIHI